MFDFFSQFLKQASSVFKKLDAKQKVVVLIVSVVSVVVIIYLMNWTGERQWEVLFSNLQAKDAQSIIDQLEEDNVPYRLQTEGTAIEVPQGTEYELRVRIQSQGLITGGVVGYEIFDRPSLGMTDFLQQVNYKRSIEGEISKSIQSMEVINMARVYIVVPKASLFVEDEKPATASVLLTVTPGQELSSEQINTIAKVVAYSVEGLQPANVTISDSYGNNLSRAINKDPLMALRSDQLRLTRQYEMEVQNKLETLLAQAVGSTNYMVSVSVDFDFTQASSVSKTYEPTPTPVRSEERENAAGGLQDTVGQASSNERSTTNYEINEMVRNTVEEFGTVNRISVAVMVNGRQVEDPNGDMIYQPRTQQELDALEASVRSAIGFNASRNDLVSVADYQFDTSALEEQIDRLAAQRREEMMQRILKWTLMSVAGLAFIFVLRSVFRSLDLLLPKPKPKPAIDIEAEAIEEEISAEAQRRAQMLDQVSKFTREKPANVAGLLNTWLIEEKEKRE
ncbi:MAG: flagellar M-ring protein FliF [bacterium]|nr:flagellar M-ring protein FliF [bacterium]